MKVTMNSITVSAPGKLMLMGEHAVVYGFPCLVTTVDRRLRVTARVIEDKGLRISAPQVTDTRFVTESVKKAHAAWGTPECGIELVTDCPFSNSYGFGSSSAVTVATLWAVTALSGKLPAPREVFDVAYKTVLAVQGVGSGFDVAAAALGGTLYYTKGGRVCKQVSLRKGQPEFVIGYTRVKANSVEIIREVAGKYRTQKSTLDRIFSAVGKLVNDCEMSLERGDWERVGKLIDFNQEYLRNIGVSTEKLEALISAAKTAGALGAKLSGAGGGDCMIALVTPDTRQAVEKAIENAGGEVVRARVGVGGVRTETTDDQTELFVVVDKGDKVKEYRTRRECHSDKTLIHRSVGVVISDAGGRILLQKRSCTKDMGAGLWGISCAGHVTKGQTEEETVHRELKEELGVDLPVSYLTKFIVADENETEMSYLYRAPANGPFTPNALEVEKIEFFEPRELVFKVASKEILLTKHAYMSLVQAGVLS